MTPSAKECNAFDKDCHIKVKKLMSYQPKKKTKKNIPAAREVSDEDVAETSDAVYKQGPEKVAFDFKKTAGGSAGDNPMGQSQYVKKGSREEVNTSPDLITKYRLKKGTHKSSGTFY